MDLIEKIKALYEQYHKADQKDPLSAYPNVQTALGLVAPGALIEHKLSNYLSQPSTEAPQAPAAPHWTGSVGVSPEAIPGPLGPSDMADSLASRSGDATMGAKPMQGMADSLAARSGDPMMQFPRPADSSVGPEEAVNLAAGSANIHNRAPASVPASVESAPQQEPPLELPGSEIGSQDNLKAALMAQNQNTLNANLLKAADTASSGLLKQKPVSQEFGDHLIKQAQGIPEQYKSLVDNQKNDPMSKVSQDYREALKQMGITVSDKSSASSLEKAAPFLTRHVENMQAQKARAEQNELQRKQHQEDLAAQMELKREMIKQAGEAKELKHQQQSEEKDTKRFDDMNKRISAEIASSRGAFGKSANIIRSSDALEALAGGLDPNKITTQQMYEMARGLDAMISQSGGTIGGTEHLIPKTAQGDLSKIKAYVSGIPQGAQQGEYVKNIMDTVHRERETAKQQLAKTQGKLLSSYSDLKDKNPEKWALVLRQNDLPEDVFDPKHKEEKSANPFPGSRSKVKVSNGKETHIIDTEKHPEDLEAALKEGFQQVQ